MQRSHDRLIFLHGLLGCPEDWDEVISYLPDFSCTALTYPFNIPSDGILIGYSMGGRIALRHPHPKIVISTHPGLKTAEEKTARLIHDQKWLDLLERPFPEFLQAWYAQPIFNSLRAHPHFQKILVRRLQQDPKLVAQMLTQESLAHQTYSTDAIFIHGQLDSKFARLYNDHQISSLELPQVGHACHLENPRMCAEALRCNLIF